MTIPTARLGRDAALLLLGLFVFAANLATPLWGDDWCRLGVATLAEAVARTAAEYRDWTGRLGPILLTYVALGPGRAVPLPWLEALNTAAFLAIVMLLLRLATLATGRPATEGRFARSFATWLGTGLLLWWLPRAIGEVALWKTGAINYAWAVALAMQVLERALTWLRAEQAPRGLAVAGLALAAMCAATFLEPLSVWMAVALGGLALLARRRGAAASRALFVVSGAQLLGTLALLAAPGNFARAAGTAGNGLASRIEGWIGFAGSLFDPLWLVAIAALLLAWRLPRRAEGASLPWRAALPFLLAAFAYLLILLPLPRETLASRVSFPASVALVGALLTWVLARPGDVARDRLLSGVLAIAFIAQAAIVARDLQAIAAFQRPWMAAVAAQPDAAELDLPLALVRNRSWVARKHRFMIGITRDPESWHNACFARANGVQRVRGI